MKTGVLEFRYGHSANFAERLRRKGFYTINLGDWIQSLAVKGLVERTGVAADDIVRVDRDSLPAYSGPPVRLIMNACFLEHCFPLPPQVEPVFVGFQTSSPELIRSYREFFKRHEPIGCRDTSTRDFFAAEGIDAYISGCLTMTLPLRTERPAVAKAWFVGGDGPGEMPRKLKRRTPREIEGAAIYHHQREAVKTFPLSDSDAETANLLAAELLETYRKEATLVVTPLLHAAGPSMAMGIPVVLARKDARDRFSAINRLLPLYIPEDFPAIDWQPAPVALEELKSCLTGLVARALAGGGGPTAAERRTLDQFYGREPLAPPALAAWREERANRPFWKKWLAFGR